MQSMLLCLNNMRAYCSAVLSAGRQTELYIALLHLCLPQLSDRIQEGAVPALLSASATVPSSTSLPAARLLPSPYPGFIDLTLTTAEVVVWRLYISSLNWIF